uniref:Uncharacterized protein n=1 Tax=Anguilla anguilla TaxID=7936 RepID=A0A0E9URB7_ANGAN
MHRSYFPVHDVTPLCKPSYTGLQIRI